MTSRPIELFGETVWVADGGLATRLEAQGHDLRGGLWSARLLRDDPAAILDAHLDFLRAGARIVTAATYQASFPGFAAVGVDETEAARLMRRAVDLAREAVDRHHADTGVTALVAASVGPWGAVLADGSEYRGRYGLTVAQLRDRHATRWEVLADTVRDGAADLLAIETMPDVDEVTALLDLTTGSGVPAWVSLTVAGGRTRARQPLHEAFGTARGVPEVVAVGVNCCAPTEVDAAIRVAHTATGLPTLAYPNSGEGWDAGRHAWTGHPTDLAALTPAWTAAGARLVGGCCRVTPAGIARIARVVAAGASEAEVTDEPL